MRSKSARNYFRTRRNLFREIIRLLYEVIGSRYLRSDVIGQIGTFTRLYFHQVVCGYYVSEDKAY